MALIENFAAGRLPPALYQAYLTPLFDTWGDVLVETLKPEGRALDLACGTGIVTRKIASHTNVDSVTGIDIASPMIEAAKAVSASDAEIEYLVASADDTNLPDEQFHSIYCQQGLQFFPDKVAALDETERLLAPGGEAAFAVWTFGKNGNPVFAAFEDVVANELGADLVPFGPFSFGDRDLLENLVRGSKLELIELQQIHRLAPLPDPRTLVLFDLLFLGRPGADGSMHPLFDPSDNSKDGQIEQIIAKLASATQQFAQDDGSLLAPSSAHIVVMGKD